MPSLNLSLDFFSHPKTIRLAATLGNGAELLPIRLWVHAGKFHPMDGLLQGYNVGEIEGFICWPGERGQAVRELLRLGFLDEIEGGFAVHDWLEHAGHFARYKEKVNKMNEKRWPTPNKSTTKSPTRNPKAGQGRAMQGKEEHLFFSNPKFKDAWAAWEKGRKKKAGPLQMSHLEKLAGGDIETAILILEESAGKGWTGIFALKGKPNGTHKPTRSEKLDEAARDFKRRFGAPEGDGKAVPENGDFREEPGADRRPPRPALGGRVPALEIHSD